MRDETAQTLGLAALAFLCAEPDRAAAFLAASGIAPDELARRAADPVLLGFVLDHLMGSEALASAFCAGERLSPEALHAARAALPGGADPHWT